MLAGVCAGLFSCNWIQLFKRVHLRQNLNIVGKCALFYLWSLRASFKANRYIRPSHVRLSVGGSPVAGFNRCKEKQTEHINNVILSQQPCGSNVKSQRWLRTSRLRRSYSPPSAAAMVGKSEIAGSDRTSPQHSLHVLGPECLESCGLHSRNILDLPRGAAKYTYTALHIYVCVCARCTRA